MPAPIGRTRGSCEKIPAMSRMVAAQPLRHKLLDLFSQEFVPLVAEQFFNLCIHQNNFSLLVNDHDSVRRGLQ